MQKALKISTFCLSLLILFNSVGIAVFEHTCNFKNETARSLYKEHACCSKKESPKQDCNDGLSFQKAECCDTDASVFVPNVFQSNGLGFKFNPAAVFDLAQPLVFAFLSFENLPTFLRFSDCSGPPLSVRSTLHLLFQVFVI